jgi:TonB family protein
MPQPDSSVAPPVEVRRVQPLPPRNAGSSGYACVHATVSVDGRLTALKLLRTDNPAFVSSCMDALQQWSYKPAERFGTPVPLDIVVSLSFSRR